MGADWSDLSDWSAEPSAAARIGASFWRDQSNGDGVESGTYAGGLVAIAAGGTAQRERIAVDAWVEVEGVLEPIHGRNRGNAQRSADGKVLGLASVRGVIRPRLRVQKLWLYGEGAGGGTVATAFGDAEIAPNWRMGLGAELPLSPRAALSLGWQWSWVGGVGLDGHRLKYDSHALVLGVRWNWRGN